MNDHPLTRAAAREAADCRFFLACDTYCFFASQPGTLTARELLRVRRRMLAVWSERDYIVKATLGAYAHPLVAAGGEA